MFRNKSPIKWPYIFQFLIIIIYLNDKLWALVYNINR